MSSIVVADMQNESDALQILALASDGQGHAHATGAPGLGTVDGGIEGAASHPFGVPELSSYQPVKMGILTAAQVATLTDIFFRDHHQFFVSQATALHSTPYRKTKSSLSFHPTEFLLVQQH